MAKRISELDVATSVSDSDYIPCVQGGVTKRATRAALYPDDVPVDTTSRILDLTGDRVPAIPDDPAGVTYFQDAWATTDGWSGTRASITTSGGKLIATCTDAGSLNHGMGRTVSSSAKLFTVKIRSSTNGYIRLYAHTGSDVLLREVSCVPGVWYELSGYVSSSFSDIFVRSGGSALVLGDTLEIDWVYIGTGAYLSKLVDRAGVPWTNYGALPVDGPFGKMLNFNGAQKIVADNASLGNTGTIAVLFDTRAAGTQQYIFRTSGGSGYNGVLGNINTNNTIRFGIGSPSAFQQLNTSYTVDNNRLVPCVFQYTGSLLKIYIGGVLHISTPQTIQVTAHENPMWVGDSSVSPSLPLSGRVILRADSRVWTDDEIARWSRDPYSEDSGLVDAFSLSFANLPTFADNAAAIAGNLPAGKLYKTSTGNVLVRY